MILKSANELISLAAAILMAAKASEENALCVARHLVGANLCGIDTHGLWQLSGYIKAIQAGEIAPTARPEVLKETATSVLVTGHWTFGQVVAREAMERVIAKAESSNVAVAGLVQAHHIGRLGEYVEMAAAHRMIAMVWAGGYAEEAPAAVPYGGRERVLHTNPVSIGCPAGEEPCMMFDFATTVASGVKLWTARQKRERLPQGWIVDKEGNPSTNPEDFFNGGAHLPFGGHKGYALMVATEFLGRVLTGADAYAETGRGGAIMSHQGVTMIVLKADLFGSFAEYAKSADEFERRLRHVPPAPGFQEVLVPGDPESRTRNQREREGIPIPEDVWQSLMELADAFQVK